MVDNWLDYRWLVDVHAAKLSGTYATFDELVSAGLAGLWDAARRYVDQGFKFRYFAERRIVGAMVDWMRKLKGRRKGSIKTQTIKFTDPPAENQDFAAIDAREQVAAIIARLKAEGMNKEAKIVEVMATKGLSHTDAGRELGIDDQVARYRFRSAKAAILSWAANNGAC